MANRMLNFRVPEELDEKAKRVAQKLGTTVSQLVRRYLVDLTENGVDQAARLDRIEKRLEEIEKKIDELKKN